MIYNNAEFMGIPWETLVKMYRRSLGNKSQPTIEAYLTDFLRFIAQERPTTRDQETVILLRVANHLFRNVLRSAKKDGSLKTSIKGYRDLFKGMDRSRSMAKVAWRMFFRDAVLS